METVFRLLRIAVALALAIAAGSLTLLFLSPLAGDTILSGLLRFLEAVMQSNDPARLAYAAFTATGRLLALFAAVPIVVTGLIGEAAGWRSGLWYIAGTALLTGAIPWLMRASLQTPTPGEFRVTAYLAAAGAVSGTVYWLLAVTRKRVQNHNDTGVRHD